MICLASTITNVIVSVRSVKKFDDEVRLAVNSSVLGLVGESVLTALYRHLKYYHAISPEEVPYHLDILVGILQETFGQVGSRTVGRAIAKRFYFRMGLKFVEIKEYTLQDYLERAKNMLQ